MRLTQLLRSLIASHRELRWATAYGDVVFVPYQPEQDSRAMHAYAVPFTGEERWVVTRRADGRWTLPGGTLEDSESWRAGLARELLEETGCSIVRYEPFGAFRMNEGPSPRFRIVSLAEVRKAQAPADPDGPRGIVEVRELPVDAASDLFTGVIPQYAAFSALYRIAAQLRAAGFLEREAQN